MEYIESERLKKFCSICDKYSTESGFCEFGVGEQARLVSKGFCNWAKINGTPVYLFTDKIRIGQREYSREDYGNI